MALRELLFVPVVFVACHAEAASGCMRAVRDLAAGAAPSAQDFVADACDSGKPKTVMRYDASMRTMRLTRALNAGEVVAAAPSAMMAGIGPGESLYVATQAGPVVVQRKVEALQAANPGQKLFVRTGDGTVMSVLYAGEGQ